MNLTSMPAPPPLWGQIAGLGLLLAAVALMLPFLARRWDRLTRHRFLRWHRGEWRVETEGHMSIYRDAICRCCRHWGEGSC